MSLGHQAAEFAGAAMTTVLSDSFKDTPRYGDTYAACDIESNSENSLNTTGFDITYKDNRAGFSIDKNSKIPLALEEVYAECTGKKLKSVLMSGGTYARRLKNAFSVGTYIISDDRKASVLKMPDGHGGDISVMK